MLYIRSKQWSKGVVNFVVIDIWDSVLSSNKFASRALIKPPIITPTIFPTISSSISIVRTCIDITINVPTYLEV